MTRHKGSNSKGVVTVEDLAEIIDCYRRIQRIQSGLNIVSQQRLPLLAASATLKACWAELSGSSFAWTYPEVREPDLDKPPEPKTYMKRLGVPGDWNEPD